MKGAWWRSDKDLELLRKQFQCTPFIKSLKLKQHQIYPVLRELTVGRAPTNRCIMLSGTETSHMGILMEGQLSCWQPVPNIQMLKPL